MGSLLGHLVPGTMFIISSLWGFIGGILPNGPNRNYSGRHRGVYSTRANYRGSKEFVEPVWYRCGGARLSKLPVEPVVKVVFALLGVLGELVESRATSLFDENGEFVSKNLDNYAHSVMYGFFGLSGVVDLVKWYALLPLPPNSTIWSCHWRFGSKAFCFSSTFTVEMSLTFVCIQSSTF